MMSSVCFLGYGLHPPWSEGTRVVTRDLSTAFEDTTWDVSTVSTIRRGETPAANVNYARESRLGDLIDVLGGYRYNLDVIMLARIARHLRNTVRSNDVDVIHAGFASHSLFSLFNDLALDRTFVAQTFGGVEHEFALELLDTPNRIDAYVSCSPGDLDSLRTVGVPEEKLHWLPAPVFTDRFADIEKARARAHFNLDMDSFVVGYLGNVNESRFPYAYAERLDSFASDDDVDAFVVTKQIEDGDIRELANITSVVRALSDEEKRLAYAAADVWVFPFQFDDTTAPIIDPPLTVLEAMAAGRPIVTTSTLSLPDIIDDGENGYLCQVGALDRLFDAVQELRMSPEKRSEIGRRARATVERRHGPIAVAERLQRIYQEAES